MEFPKEYLCLNKNLYKKDEYTLLPIRFEDRVKIMKWRNEQIYHLRQDKLLDMQQQNDYYNNVVAQLFKIVHPNQLLFSLLKNNELIAYGGLVHINWIDKHAEISFLMDTNLEKEFFIEYWHIFLNFIEQIAFYDLQFVKIFTFAYDMRPKLYEALALSGFDEEARLKNHCIFEGKIIDVLIHAKMNTHFFVDYRVANLNDLEIMFEWANDPVSRANSFYPNEISLEEHTKWYNNKLDSQTTIIFIAVDKVLNEKIGVVRYEIGDTNSIVGIHIDQKYRGKKLAKKLLVETADIYFSNESKPIWAYIKRENTASVKAFINAGYVYFKEDEINGVNCDVYKLKMNNAKK